MAKLTKEISSVAGLSALFLACASPSETKQASRDSAGIRIVENSKPAWTVAQQLRLSPTPSLVIGDRDEEPYILSRVQTPVTLSDGRIVFANGSSSELRVFDASGTYLKAIGRKGDGPGEFQDIAKVSRLPGDTIAVIHGRSDVSLFDADGTFIRKLTVPREIDGQGRPTSITSVLFVLNGNSRMVVNYPFGREDGPVGSRFDVRVTHKLFNQNNSPLQDLGLLPVQESIYEKEGARYVWLCAVEHATNSDSSFFLGYGKEYSIGRYNSQGKLEQIVRRAWTPHELTKADIDTFVGEWLVRWSPKPGPDREKDRADLLDDPYAINLPAFSAILADRTGRLWVRTPKPIDAAVAGFLSNYSIGPSSWSVFGSDGVWLGDVTMPARFMPSEIGADYVMGVQRDEDGVQTVVRYRLGTG